MGVLAAAGGLFAGPLSPPAGPVAGTSKTLLEVEPRTAINALNTPGDADSLFKITQPGSYYLAGNVTGEVGKHGIEIASHGVSIDLNGFDLVGMVGQGAFDAVTSTVSSLKNISVTNGSIRNWGGDGVDLRTSGSSNCRISSLVVTGNAGTGINVLNACTLIDCVVETSGVDGIYTGSGCQITGCISRSNVGIGFRTSEHCTLNNCIAYGNSVGFDVFRFCTLTNCDASGNDTNGIDASSTASLPVATTISMCTANQNGGVGIATGINCIVDQCTVSDNELDGIAVLSGSLVTNCSSYRNTLNGIKCSSRCVIRGNMCSSNGNLTGAGAGINVTSSNNRIEDNNCTNADVGIDVDVAGNVIIRNTCADNTQNFLFVANNIFGAIVDRTAPASGAVNGNTAAGTMGSTDPNANFAY